MKSRRASSPAIFRLLGLLIAVDLVSVAAAADDDKAYQLITSQGGEIELGKSVPGVIDLIGDHAFALARDKNQKIVAAAGDSGNGRAVAFSHGSFLKGGAIAEQPATASLIQNAIRWAGRSSSPKVGVHPELPALAESLATAGFTVETLPPSNAVSSGVAVYCVAAQRDFSDDAIAGLQEFTQDGGGLVTAATPWAFKKNHPDFATFPGNQLVASAGLRYQPDGYASNKEPLVIGAPALAGTPDGGEKKPEMKPEAKPIGGGDDARGKSAALTAVEKLIEVNGKAGDELNSLVAAMKTGMDLRGDAMRAFLEALRTLNETVGPIVPTKEAPIVPGADPLVDAIILIEDELNQRLPAGQMYAIPASSDYPGEVPEDAERITRELTIDGTWKGWLRAGGAGGWAAKEMRPTGLYAAPGEIIKVTAPGSIAGEGFEVVIGAYGGSLKNRDEWHRYPRLQRKMAINGRVTEISSGLGGLITIRVPRGAEESDLEFSIEGGIAAPLYVHGKTDLRVWQDEIRKFPAPWAELASERMIIALPADYIRKLSDPDEVMEVWNGIIDTAAVLVQVDRNDYRAERIVFDRQTSAGSMHSSYPVAAHTGRPAEQAVDASALKREGNWGFFHEYGHNHQHDLWSLPGTGETTCNLWSVYVYEEYIGKNRNETHRAIRPLDRKQRMNAYFQNGRNFQSEWSTWVALEPYLQVQEAFGWEPFQKVFDEYNRLPREDGPKTQQEKNDEWVIRLSKACGQNLAPFWAAWNLPLSESVFSEVDHLPAWEDHPVKRFVE